MPILWQRPDYNNPDNYRERYGSLGQVIREWTGPNRNPPMLLQPPGNTGVTGNIVQNVRSAGAGGGNIGLAKRGTTTPTGVMSNTNVGSSGGGGGNTIFGNYIPQPNTDLTPIRQKAQQDYDRMMNLYEGLLKRNSLGTIRERLNPITPAQETNPIDEVYNEDPRLGGAIGGLSELAKTGGYSAEDIANLRERGLSPIRAVYANAQRELQRGKNLAGGYAPNLGAVTSKMAREISDLISGRTTDINAGIAEQVARNKLQVAPQLADALLAIQREKGGVGARNIASRREMEGRNVATRNRAEEINRELLLKERELDQSDELDRLRVGGDILGGMRSLYGTSPGLADSFANQVLREGELNQRGGSTLIDAYLRALRG